MAAVGIAAHEAGHALQDAKNYAPLVIRNAAAQAPYPIDVLFLYMANMAWNSSMNSKGTMEMLTDIDEETGEYRREATVGRLHQDEGHQGPGHDQGQGLPKRREPDDDTK